jgi:DNA-binding LytR/AlgR family response regulator
MKCLAVDDEPLALKLIENYCNQIPFIDLVDQCINPFQALSILQREQIDLLFLDIRMPDISGLQFLTSLKEKPLVILTTAYKQYALESYDLDVVDYLLKPISMERFLKSVNKAKEILDLRQKKITATEENPNRKDDFIFVHSEYNLIRININEILYIEGYKDYIKVFTIKDSKPILTIMRLKTFEENLPTDQFIRIHRSFLVNFDKITSIRKNRVTIAGKEIPVGDLYAEPFFQLINKKNWANK